MNDHIERMKTEHKELKERIDKLNTFIYCNDMFQRLDDQEKVRMIKQSGFMESYLSVLESRIWCGESGNLRLNTLHKNGKECLGPGCMYCDEDEILNKNEWRVRMTEHTSGFRKVIEITNKHCEDIMDDIYFVSKSRMENIIDCLESGAKEIKNLKEKQRDDFL